MNRDLHHDEIEELLGGYAVNALDSRERAVVEQHLDNCPDCRREVSQHHEVAALLVPDGPPPDGLWDRIAETLEATPPPLELSSVVSLDRRRRRGLRILAAATAVAAAAIGVLGFRLVDQGRQLDSLQSAMTQDALQRAALSAIANTAASKIDLRSSDRVASAQIALLPDGRGYLLADSLPALAPDRTYQLWALVDGERISAGTLGTRPTVAAFHVSGPVTGFAVTDETAGGVVASKNAPILIGFRPT
jgi:anti-sigma factor RsiW